MALAAFGGTCYNCQEKGHRPNQCPKKDGPSNGNHNASGNNRGKFKGECNNCGKIGHKKSECWQLEKNNNKRPKDYRRGNAEHGNPAISGGTGDDDSDAKFLMCAMCYDKEEVTNEEGISVLTDKHEYNEDETFDFVSENEEEEYEVSMMLFEDVDYPLPDEDLAEIALCAMKVPNSMKLLLDPNVCIADTGATVHDTPNSSAMIKKSDRNGNDSVIMGNGKSEATEWYGDLPVTLCDMEGNTKGDSKITHVAYVPTSKLNLFSLTRMMINNWIIGGDENSIWLEKGRNKIVFDIKITTSTGAIYCTYMKRRFELTNLSTDGKRKEITYTVLQARLGNSNEDATRATADVIGMKLIKGGMGTCLACTIGKAKQKNVKNVKNKSEGTKSKEPGGRIYLDISTVKDKKGEPNSTKNNWRIMVDESTNLKISHFYAKKDGMCEPTCEMIKILKDMEI
jgi:hypothetical protein